MPRVSLLCHYDLTEHMATKPTAKTEFQCQPYPKRVIKTFLSTQPQNPQQTTLTVAPTFTSAPSSSYHAQQKKQKKNFISESEACANIFNTNFQFHKCETAA